MPEQAERHLITDAEFRREFWGYFKPLKAAKILAWCLLVDVRGVTPEDMRRRWEGASVSERTKWGMYGELRRFREYLRERYILDEENGDEMAARVSKLAGLGEAA